MGISYLDIFFAEFLLGFLLHTSFFLVELPLYKHLFREALVHGEMWHGDFATCCYGVGRSDCRQVSGEVVAPFCRVVVK